MDFIMKFSDLEAISPVDGRYRRATAALADYFSEAALIKYRVLVEVESPPSVDHDGGLTYCVSVWVYGQTHSRRIRTLLSELPSGRTAELRHGVPARDSGLIARVVSVITGMPIGVCPSQVGALLTLIRHTAPVAPG